jgi:hypothetical protein
VISRTLRPFLPKKKFSKTPILKKKQNTPATFPSEKKTEESFGCGPLQIGPHVLSDAAHASTPLQSSPSGRRAFLFLPPKPRDAGHRQPTRGHPGPTGRRPTSQSLRVVGETGRGRSLFCGQSSELTNRRPHVIHAVLPVPTWATPHSIVDKLPDEPCERTGCVGYFHPSNPSQLRICSRSFSQNGHALALPLQICRYVDCFSRLVFCRGRRASWVEDLAAVRTALLLDYRNYVAVAATVISFHLNFQEGYWSWSDKQASSLHTPSNVVLGAY